MIATFSLIDTICGRFIRLSVGEYELSVRAYNGMGEILSVGLYWDEGDLNILFAFEWRGGIAEEFFDIKELCGKSLVPDLYDEMVPLIDSVVFTKGILDYTCKEEFYN